MAVAGRRPERKGGVSDPPAGQRIDKWLWAARFFKTRGQAAEAVAGGKVHVDGQRVKPARRIRVGEAIEIRRGDVRWEIRVTGLREERRPASEARALYAELPESVARREREAEERRSLRAARALRLGKPDKRGRRAIARLKDSG